MILEEVFKKTKKTSNKKKNVVLVGIKMDGQSRELLGWALAKAAEAGDCVIAVHVCRSFDQSVKDKPIVDSYVEAYEGLCNVKKVDLISQVSTGSSVGKALVKEAKNHETTAVVVGTSKSNIEGDNVSTAKYCAKKLPPSTEVVAINKGEIVYRRCTSNNEQSGLAGDETRPSISQIYNSIRREKCQSEYGDSEADTETVKSFSRKAQSLQASPMRDNEDLKTDSKRAHIRSASSRSIDDSAEKHVGRPLRRGNSAQIPERNMSVVQWVMSLPDRSPQHIPKCSIIRRTSFEGGFRSTYSTLDALPNELKSLLKTNRCKWFSHEVLKAATSNFCSGNLIGKGGCNLVYKGILPDCKKVAVKVMKSSKATWKDFAHEISIISSLRHEKIMPLLGFCPEENDLISVYDYTPIGSLEENLHGENKGKPVLSWEARYKAAVGTAEALSYLHNDCSPPVIHRDVKSANILLTPELEPRLSDFGLAIWGPTNCSSTTECNVVGTFGYLAPEYCMYGKISDKIDVYAFGVVLLELISGRIPIGSDTNKKQESLIMWAKPKLENGDVHDIVDPNFDGNFNEIQVSRMVQAAKLCITRSARRRPKMSQIVKLLKGDPDIETYLNSLCFEDSDNRDDNDDEVYPNSSPELHLNLALLDIDEDDDTTSFSSADKSNRSWDEYLKGR